MAAPESPPRESGVVWVHRRRSAGQETIETTDGCEAALEDESRGVALGPGCSAQNVEWRLTSSQVTHVCLFVVWPFIYI